VDDLHFEAEMARFRYYLSHAPTSLSPPTEELLNIEADSPANAVERISDRDTWSVDWPSIWVHVLVSSTVSGEQRGFESTRLR
jgi:hypothetical protein